MQLAFLLGNKRIEMKTVKIVLLIAVVAISSCKKDKTVVGGDTKSPLSIPSTYSSPSFSTNASVELDVAGQLGSLTTYMKKAQDASFKLNKDSLNYFFSGNGNPSLKTVAGSYYANLIENTWFDIMVASSQNTYDPTNGASATVGGVFGGRLLNAKGKENIQEIEKGLYLAALFNHLINVSNGTITEASIDKMLAVIGGNPSFPNSYTSNVNSPDKYVLKYVSRRDKNDGNGFYTNIKNGFLKLKAAVAAGDEYKTEQNAAIAAIRSNIEKSMAATNINYCYGALSKLSATNPTNADKAGALHDLGEAIGFIHGLKAVPASARIITDAQVDEIITLLLAPSTGPGSAYQFVTNGATYLPQLTTAQNKLKAIYGFSTTEMDDFKNNWVSVQGR